MTLREEAVHTFQCSLKFRCAALRAREVKRKWSESPSILQLILIQKMT